MIWAGPVRLAESWLKLAENTVLVEMLGEKNTVLAEMLREKNTVPVEKRSRTGRIWGKPNGAYNMSYMCKK